MAKTSKNTKQKLISAAIPLFAKKGYDGVSTAEICEAAQANVAALHYHFKTKENLYHTIIHQFGTESLASALRILRKPERLEEVRVRLESFLYESVELFLERYDLTQIVQREIEAQVCRHPDIFRSTFHKMFESLVGFIDAAVQARFLSVSFDSAFMAGALFAQLSSAIKSDPINRRFFKQTLTDPAYRKRWVESTVGLFLEGALLQVN
ncbi:TetR family transcriptional regulator [Bdellovibrionota bacterium FG-2]